MSHLCTKCNMTWKRLWIQADESGDEQYEYCPKCNSAIDLVEISDTSGYVKCALTGRVHNPDTGKEYHEEQPDIDFGPDKPLTWRGWNIEQDEEKVKEEDDLMDAYAAVYEKDGKEAAELFYKNRFKTT